MISHSVDTDGAVTVTVNGGAELAPVREKLLLFVLAEKQWTHLAQVNHGAHKTRTRAIIPGAVVDASFDENNAAAFVAPDTVDADEGAPLRHRRMTVKKRKPAKKPQGQAEKSAAKPAKQPERDVEGHILATLAEHGPCSPRTLWSKYGLSSGPGPNHARSMRKLISEGRVIAEGSTTNRTLSLPLE